MINCPKCRMSNFSQDSVCTYCKTPLTGVLEGPQAPAPPAVVQIERIVAQRAAPEPPVEYAAERLAGQEPPAEFAPELLARSESPVEYAAEPLARPEPPVEYAAEAFTRPEPPVEYAAEPFARPEPPVEYAVEPFARPEPPVEYAVEPFARPEPPVEYAVEPFARPEPPVEYAAEPLARPEPPAEYAVEPFARPEPSADGEAIAYLASRQILDMREAEARGEPVMLADLEDSPPRAPFWQQHLFSSPPVAGVSLAKPAVDEQDDQDTEEVEWEPGAAPARGVVDLTVDPRHAAICSFFAPGSGQVLKGQAERGFGLLFLLCASYLFLGSALISGVVWLGIIFDAFLAKDDALSPRIVDGCRTLLAESFPFKDPL